MLTEAENALVTRIKDAPIGQKLREVNTLPDLDGDTLVKKFATDAPAAYVAPAATFGIVDSIMDVGFGIACVARNAAGQAATRQGDGKVIGLYEMVEIIAGMLDGFVAGEIPLYAISVSIMNDEKIYKSGLQVAVISLQGKMKLPSAIDESNLDDFLTLGGQYDVMPHASSDEHLKWKQEPSDHSTSEPEIKDTLTVQS